MVARFQLDVHGWEIPAPKGRAFNGKSIELHTFPAMPCLMSLMTPELFLLHPETPMVEFLGLGHLALGWEETHFFL
jgi:hypothetical protein